MAPVRRQQRCSMGRGPSFGLGASRNYPFREAGSKQRPRNVSGCLGPGFRAKLGTGLKLEAQHRNPAELRIAWALKTKASWEPYPRQQNKHLAPTNTMSREEATHLRVPGWSGSGRRAVRCKGFISNHSANTGQSPHVIAASSMGSQRPCTNKVTKSMRYHQPYAS